jgi:hypothetical protein
MRKTEETPEHYDIGKGCLIGTLFIGIAVIVTIVLMYL